MTSTPSCIAIGCKAEIDGSTDVTLGPMHELSRADKPTFEGTLETPSRSIAVSIVPNKRILQIQVPTTRTRVRVWANDAWEPDRLIIAVE